MSATEIGRNDDWATPQDRFDELDKEFHFDVDVCANKFNHKCEKYWTIEDDGLAQDWTGLHCFMNPPYGRTIGKWIRKARESTERGGGNNRRCCHSMQDGYKMVGRCYVRIRGPFDSW